MNKERLKMVLEELREEYEKEWKSVEDIILKHLDEVREIIRQNFQNNTEIDFETSKEIYEKIQAVDELTTPFLLWISPSPGGFGMGKFGDLENIREKILNNRIIIEFLIEVKSLENLEDLQRVKERIERLIKSEEIIGVRIANLSTWMCIFNPKLFAPTFENTVNKYLRNDLGIDRFWGGHSDVDKFIEFTRTIKEVSDELGIKNMLEAAFYLSKYQHKSKTEQTQNYWIEVGGPPSKEYIGKFLWAPKAPQWNLLRDVQKDDIIYHYVTSKGPVEFREKFIGKSKAKEQAKEIDKKELVRLMKEIDENWEDFFEGWRDYETFYLVELYDFREFKKPVSKDEVGFNPPSKYFIKARPEIVDKIERLTSTQKVSEIDEETRKKMDNLLASKKQVILYGPPGTGKTWLAKNFVNSELECLGTEGKIFVWKVNPDTYDYRNKINEASIVEIAESKLKLAFEEIQPQDTVFIFVDKTVGRIYGVGKCISKNDKKIIIKILKRFDGPTREELKIAGLNVISSETSQLIKLNDQEAIRLIKLTSKQERNEFVTFHPSYSYEEFVEGLKPVPAENGVRFVVEDGIFKRMALKAICEALLDKEGVDEIAQRVLRAINETKSGIASEEDIYEKYREYSKAKRRLWDYIKSLSEEELKEIFAIASKFYLIIDEINRGDISKIFGELITLLEADKRLGEGNQIIVTLPYSKEPFAVPPNLYIIGTMNTADRSIALIDIALRRRFGFIELMPDYGILEKALLENDASEEVKEIRKLAINVLKALNERIKREYDRDHQIGHSYLLKLKEAVDRDATLTTLKFIWYHEILPLLQEYFYDSPDKLAKVLNGRFVEVGESYSEFKELEGDDFLAKLRGVAESGEQA